MVECPLCRSRPLRIYDRDYRGITICRCRGCGLKLMNPQYSDAHLAAYYAEYITTDYPFGEDIKAVALARKLEIFDRIANYVPVGRLLCFGCGDGLELKVAREQGWTVEGYDVDPATTDRVAKALGVPVYCGRLDALGLAAASYDCVYMDQVLEHPKRPQECLLEAHRLLRRGGILFVGCPNIMSVASIGKTLLDRLRLKPLRGRHYDTAHHLFYFSPRVLRRLLERQFGFRVLHVQGDPFVWERRLPSRIKTVLYRQFPWLDSTFQVFAQKATDVVETGPRSGRLGRAA